MKKTILIIVLAALCPFFKVLAQDKGNIRNLQVGDKMPDVLITKIFNSQIKTAHIAQFQGKLILIDFWSTWCPACIEGFSELDSLQRLYPDKIQILLVNPKKEGDNEKGVKIVINRMNAWSTRRFKLPIVFQDTAITNKFQFQSLPHCVWIAPNGKIIGVTGKEAVNIQNIKKGIAGNYIELYKSNH